MRLYNKQKGEINGYLINVSLENYVFISYPSRASWKWLLVKWMSLKWKLRNIISAFHHKMQLVQFRFGIPVVKRLQDRPCDGARHVGNAQLKPMHRTMKKSSLLQLWGCPRREKLWGSAKSIPTYQPRPAVYRVFVDWRPFALRPTCLDYLHNFTVTVASYF